MFVSKLKTAAILVLVIGLLAAGGGITYRLLAAEPAGQDQPTTPKPAREDAETEGIKVSSERDGILLVVGTEIKEGEKVAADRVITVAVGGASKKYRRLAVGDSVVEGQLLAQLDDRLARDDLAIKREQLAQSEANWQAAKATAAEAQERLHTLETLKDSRSVPVAELRAAQLTQVRYSYEEKSQQSALAVAKLEVKRAETIVAMYQIRSPVRGTIKALYKKRGEAVRALEPVTLIVD